LAFEGSRGVRLPIKERHLRPRRLRHHLKIFASLAAILTAVPLAQAQSLSSLLPTTAVPLPPARPADLEGTEPAHHDRVAAAPPPIALPQHQPPPETSSIQAIALRRELPPATRPQMRACAIKWHMMKKSGKAGDKTWRDFAQNCLAP
jgi:hypothetical protein